MSSERRSSRRSDRDERKSSSAKAKVLERLKAYQKTGAKVEYDGNDDEDIYEYVDDDEYAQIVQERQQDDFVVDDDGDGYLDDGREIFDEDLNAEKPAPGKKGAKGGGGKKAKEEGKPSGSAKQKTKITSMFAAASAATKKKDKQPKDATLKDDEFLDDLLNSMLPGETSTSSTTAAATSSSALAGSSIKMSKLPKKKKSSNTNAALKRKPLTSLSQQRNTSSTSAHSKDFPTPRVKQEDITIQDDDDISMETESLTSVRKKPSVKARKNEDVEIEINEDDDIRVDDLSLEDVQPGFDRSNNDDEEEEEVRRVKTEAVDEVSLVEASDFDQDVDDMMMDEGLVKKEDVSQDRWHTMFDDNNEEEKVVPPVCDTSAFPTIKVDGEDVLRVFWLDAYEDKYNQPGTVYLFGKIWSDTAKAHVSCCISVKNIKRQLYILPRPFKRNRDGSNSDEPVEFKDMYEEFDQNVASKHKIMEYKCRKVTKKYAFDLSDVPRESDYLEVQYNASQTRVPENTQGNTFSRVFGTNTSSLELLLLNRKLQGPAWIDLKYPQKPSQSISWCKYEVVIDNPTYITPTSEPPPPPPLSVLSLSMIATTHAKTHDHEVISFAGLVQPSYHLDKGAPDKCFTHSFCLVTKPSDELLPYDFQSTIQKSGSNIQITTSERSMLGLLLAKIQQLDPDVIVGHDIQGFDFDVLLQRVGANKVAHWSKLGRLKRSTLPKSTGSRKQFESSISSDKAVAVGRLVVDCKVSGKELIRCKSYDLSELVSVVLNKARDEVNVDDVAAHIRRTNTLLTLLNINRMDAMYALQLMYELQILPLAHQITGICGNVMSRTLLGGRSERNEYLLLHAFHEKNYLLPDKTYGQKDEKKGAGKKKQDGGVDNEDDAPTQQQTQKGKGRKKPAYTGGLVLEPKKGFYDKYILLLDFNSLYPSIIQEYNICFTTITNTNTTQHAGDDEENLPDLPGPEAEAGVLPTEIKRLVDRRKAVKNLLRDAKVGSDQYMQYDIRQKALKLTANSMYGCLGFTYSRFYAKALAALVTGKGREILLKTKDLATTLGLDVIYGDTDSIMINTNSEDVKEVRKIGAKVKAEVNKLYRLVEIEIDGIYKSMLLLKKKKYAAVLADIKPDGTIQERIEMKGLDIVRRDWSGLAKEAGTFALNEILSGKARETLLENIHEYLRTTREMLANGKVEMEKFQIHKSLTKNPAEYPDKKSLPHVQVAQKLISAGRRVAIGDTISYVICDDATQLPASQRAYHVDELQKNTNLKIDQHYYLSSQIHPVVSRLCDTIEGTDPALIASCLGLDPTAYKTRSTQAETEDTQLNVLMSNEERFKDVEKYYVECTNTACSLHKQSVEFLGSLDTRVDPLECATCHTSYNVTHLCNGVRVFARACVEKYYNAWLTCDDPACGYTTRQVSVKYMNNTRACQDCHKGNVHSEYTDGKLYNQLFYLSHILDSHATNNEELRKIRNKDPRWNLLQRESNKMLNNNAYAVVNILNLFTNTATTFNKTPTITVR